jgi:hypothetical protein
MVELAAGRDEIFAEEQCDASPSEVFEDDLVLSPTWWASLTLLARPAAKSISIRWYRAAPRFSIGRTL